RYTDNNQVLNNSLYNNKKEIHLGHGGRWYNAGNNNVFKNNILYIKSGGTGIAVDTYGDPGTLPSGTVFDYNNLYPASENAHIGRIDNNNYNSLSAWQSASGQDNHSKSSDPLFASTTPGILDFHLKSTGGRWTGTGWTVDLEHSPSIDAGDPSSDYSLEPFPNGNRINQGAYGNKAHASKSASTTYTYTDFPRMKWVLFGVPVIPINGNPQSIIADDLDNADPGSPNWRLSRWNTADSTYYRYSEEEPNYYDSSLPSKPSADPPDLYPGLGYWLLQDVLDSPDIDVLGFPASKSQDFRIPLDPPVNGHRGLNMNANPFNFKIDWSNTKVTDGSETKSIKDAGSAGWLNQYAYTWDSDNSQYVPINPNEGSTVDTLSIWQGFWTIQLDAARSCTLLVPPTEIIPKPARATPQWLTDHLGQGRSPLISQSEESWFLQLTVQSKTGTHRDVYNGAGVAPDALITYDYHDAFEFTPSADEFVQLYFPHNDTEDPRTYWPDQPYTYTYDIRDIQWTQQEWLFHVYQYKSPGDYRLSWLNLRLVPQTVKLSLYDPDNETFLVNDLRQTGEYNFNLSNENPYQRFEIKAKVVEDHTPPEFTIGITQNTILTGDLDIYVLPSERLNAIQADINGVELELAQIDLTNFVYHGDYELDNSGTLTIHISGEDLSGNTGEGSKVIAVQLMKSVTGGTIQSPDGRLTLSIPDKAISYDRYITVFSDELDGEPEGLSPVGPWYRINPGMKLSAEAALSFYYNDEELDGLDEGKLSIYLKDVSRWIPLSGEVRKDENRVTARITRLGAYRLFHNPNATISPGVPESYALNQNYPNPFNTITVIRYQLPEASKVTLKIYNILGQEVKTLVDKIQTPGYYSVIWDGKNSMGEAISSGIYLYKIQGKSFTTSKKMIHIK
ncbi:MAG: FlgD immunoglobulin-like domain containing protein, partial [Fidelibacterota bacterium]